MQFTFIYIYSSSVYSRLQLLLSFYILLEKLGDEVFKPERVKRRHARPHELDSDDNEDKRKEDNTIQKRETSDKVEAIVPVDDSPKILVKKKKDLK